MKECSKCGIEKDESEFNRMSRGPDGFQYKCRECSRKAYYDNREKRLRRCKEYYLETREKRLIENKIRYAKNKDKILAQQKEYTHKNRDRIYERNRKYNKMNPLVNLKACKKYRKNNKEKRNISCRKWENKNKEKRKLIYKKSMERAVKELPDWYMKYYIRQKDGLDRESIELNPGIIELRRLQILTNRLLKK